MSRSYSTRPCSKNIPHSLKNSYHPKAKDQDKVLGNINKLRICCHHHIMLNKIAEADVEDPERRRTQDNFPTITQTIVDVETCIMSSKIAHLLQSLIKNNQTRCGPTKSVVYTQWTQFLDLCANSNMHPLPIECI
ncbi:hypothetical protein O181_118942 [Austropuccinia psidii MF-1]|uniref:Uncharacterized protein n=1 Tax=Austropuccinia psidii MF-1 TaxID=1389203 RepID=A0A9Q3KGA0_9BASI|nr:hypothetical protein [Austropuccinia psidii MF-1]